MKQVKTWWFIALVAVLVGAGAASGTILVGYLEGGLAVDVSPPLQLEEPWVEGLPEAQTVFVALDGDRQAFRVAAEVQLGDCFFIHLPVVNKSTVDVKARLTLLYPYGTTPLAAGSGVIDDVVAVHYRAWKFTADAGAQGSSASPYDGVTIQVCVSPYFTGSTVEIRGYIESTSGIDGPSVVFMDFLTEDTIYLHNDPSPPTGDTSSQPNLPMDRWRPTRGVLYNYDADNDADAGRIILHGDGNSTESDLQKYQNWQITVSEDLNINGTVTVVLWSAVREFDQTARGIVTAYLRHFSGGTYIEIASSTLDLTPWQQGSATWVKSEILIEDVQYIIPAGHILELKVVVEEDSPDMWFAYDTTQHPSQLVMPGQVAENVLYVHNNPTPPTGDTTRQADLSMDTTAPTAEVLYNYDTDKDLEPGRNIHYGGSGTGEGNLDKYQNWQFTIPEDLHISGDVSTILWSATKTFDTTKRGIVTAYLRDFDGAGYTEIANGTLDMDLWQQGSTTWVEREIIITGVDYTVLAGHILELKIIVNSGSHDMWFAYDTTDYPSRVVLP